MHKYLFVCVAFQFRLGIQSLGPCLLHYSTAGRRSSFIECVDGREVNLFVYVVLERRRNVICVIVIVVAMAVVVVSFIVAVRHVCGDCSDYLVSFCQQLLDRMTSTECGAEPHGPQWHTARNNHVSDEVNLGTVLGHFSAKHVIQHAEMSKVGALVGFGMIMASLGSIGLYVQVPV